MRRDLRQIVIPVGLVVLAVGVRLAWLDLAEFHYDEAANMVYTLEAMDAPGLPTLGRSSDLLNTPTPPHTFYLYTLMALFTTNPVAWTGVIAMVNALGVGLLYLLGARIVAPRAAVIGAALYAVNPYAVLFSRKIWEPEWVAPFFIGALLLCWLGFVEGRRWAQLAALPALALVPMLHLSATPLLAVGPLLLWRGRGQLHKRSLWIGVVAALALVTPFLVGLVTGELPDGGARVREAVRPTTITLRMLADFVFGLRYDLRFAPFQTVALLGPLAPMRYVWAGIGGVLAVAGLVRAVRERQVMLLVWVFASALALTVGVITPYVRYLLGAIPAVCLLMGLGADALLRWRVPRVLVWSGVGVLVVFYVAAWWTMLDYGARVAVPYGYTVPLRAWMDARDAVPPGTVALATTDDSDGVVQSTIWRALLWERGDCVTRISSRDVLLAPEPYTLLVPLGAAAHPATSRGSAAQIGLRPGDPSYVRYRVVPPLALPTVTEITPVRYENDLQWTGYAVDGDSLWIRWRLPEVAAGSDVAAYVRGYDAEGGQVADVVINLPPTWGWCDQTMVTEVTLPELADAASAGVALLERPVEAGNLRYVPVVDAAGLPVALEATQALE